MSAGRNYIRKEVQEYLLDMWWLAIRNSHEQAKKDILLDYDEAIAVYAYTNVCPPFYEKINDALRSGENHYLVELIDSALSKLPIDESSVVHRLGYKPITIRRADYQCRLYKHESAYKTI
jgi:hypothetical protein